MCVDHGPFRQITLDLAAQASDLLGCPAPDPAALTVESHVGPGSAVSAPEDSPRIRELGDLVVFHTGGAAALFAKDLA